MSNDDDSDNTEMTDERFAEIEAKVLEYLSLQNAFESIDPDGDWLINALDDDGFSEDEIDVLKSQDMVFLFLQSAVANGIKADEELEERKNEWNTDYKRRIKEIK
jgi:hypothetical protein